MVASKVRLDRNARIPLQTQSPLVLAPNLCSSLRMFLADIVREICNSPISPCIRLET